MLSQDRWMTTPTATAHVTLQDAAGTAKSFPSQGKSSGLPSVVRSPASADAAVQQAYMPFSTGPRRSSSLAMTRAHQDISSHAAPLLHCCMTVILAVRPAHDA